MPGKNTNQNPYDYLLHNTAEDKNSIDRKTAGQNFSSLPESPAPAEEIYQTEFDRIMEIESNNRELAATYIDRLNSGNRAERDATRSDIKTLIASWGLNYIDGKAHYPLSRDEKHIIRMDFYGSINETDKTPAHSRHTKKYLRHLSSYPSKLPPQEYDLETSPIWKLFRQFPRFRKIETRLKQQLQAMNIPADMLPHMNAYDFSDVLYKAFYDPETAPKAYMFLGARRSFVKDFIRKNEAAFRDYLQKIRVHPAYAEELIANMKKYGKTSNIYVIDHDKGVKLLNKYKQKGILPAGTVISPKLSAQQIELIRNRGEYYQIALLDENGHPLSGPDFSVHHKVAVKDAADTPDLLYVNRFENLCLTVTSPYHQILHSLDMTQKIDRRECYISRIYMDKNLVFWGGFHKLFHIYYDYRNDTRSLRQKQQHNNWKKDHPAPSAEEHQRPNRPEAKESRQQKKERKKYFDKKKKISRNKIRTLAKIIGSLQQTAARAPSVDTRLITFLNKGQEK